MGFLILTAKLLQQLLALKISLTINDENVCCFTYFGEVLVFESLACGCLRRGGGAEVTTGVGEAAFIGSSISI